MWNAFRQFIAQFIPVEEEAFEAARPYFREVLLQKGDFFVREGEVCGQLGYLHQGLLRSFYLHESGEEMTYCFCSDHQLECAFKSFLLEQPSGISIQALEDSRMLMISKQDLDQLFDSSLFWSRIGRSLTAREYLKMERYAADQKVENAREKYLSLLKEHPDLIGKVPLHYIASYLGISGRHLSRLRRELLSLP
jgi:CRP-like cAMP-binding protein